MKLLYLDCFAGISGDMFLGTGLALSVMKDLMRRVPSVIVTSVHRLSIAQE